MRHSAGVVAVLLLGLAAGAYAAEAGNPNLTNKLVDLIAKRQYENFVKELASEGMDVNQPDSKGRLPLMEAVKSADIRFVDALIQFGALAKSRDPATGTPPLLMSFMTGKHEIASLLLRYGADLNVTDKSGKKPRDFAPTKEIRDLIVAYDEKGSLAFEDVPGAWVRSTNDKGEKFWFNAKTSEARWDTPPSCAWQRVTLQGQHARFVNSVTGQYVNRLPPALSWRKVNLRGEELWYNWASNHTQIEQPDELPAEMLEEASSMKNVRWYNPVTNEFAWEDPATSTAWRTLYQDEKPYYYNIQTGESTWEVPEELAWKKVEHSEQQGAFFWYNEKTGESTWEVPQLHAWEKHSNDL